MSLSLSGDGTVTGVTAIGDVSSTELGYLDGVTSALQTQINTKADASSQGLVLIDEESFSAVSSVSLNNVFSSTYSNYRIVVTNKASGNASLTMRYRTSGSDFSSSVYVIVGTSTNSGGSNTVTATTTSFGVTSVTDQLGDFTADILSPFESKATTAFFRASRITAAGALTHYSVCGVVNNTNSFDGLSLAVDSGTFTGTIRVYGYKGA